jgi:esterase/lipase superfamily enzyme
LLNDNASPWEKIEWLKRYDAYITEEVLPLIREDCHDANVRPIVAGISLGAYLAGNTFFRHPDLFGGAILLSGSYDIRSYLGSFHNDDVYFNNPVEYLPRMDDDYHLPILQHGNRRIIIFSGQGSYEAPDRSRQISRILNDKGVPHWLDIWGHDVTHDWPWWRDAMPYYFGELFG